MRGLGQMLQGLSSQLGKVKVDPLEAGMRFAPDLLFAGMAAATAPGGPSLAVGAEDLGISLLGSGLGWGISGAARRFAGDRLKGLDPRMTTALEYGTDLVPTMALQYAMPRPQLMNAIETATRDEQERQRLLAEQEQLTNLEQLGLAGFAGGLLASPALAPTPAALSTGFTAMV